MDALIGRLCDRLEAGGTRLGTAVATIWRGGRTATADPETPATVHIKYYVNIMYNNVLNVFIQ